MGNRLKELRLKNGYTQKEVTTMLIKKNAGVTIKTYRGYEKDNKNIPLDVLQALGEVYACNIEYLLGGSEYKNVDNANISQITGLSEKAIQNIKELKKMDENALYEGKKKPFSYIEILDKILSSKYFPQLIINFSEVSKPHYTILKEDIMITPDILRRLALDGCRETLDKISRE